MHWNAECNIVREVCCRSACNKSVKKKTPYLFVDWPFSLLRVKIFFLGLQIYSNPQTFSRRFCLVDAAQGYFPAFFI